MGKESPKNLLESLGMQVPAWECRFLPRKCRFLAARRDKDSLQEGRAVWGDPMC